MDKKKCLTCSKVVYRGKRSRAYFATRKFCSSACYYKSPESKKGQFHTGHSGMVGSKNPSWKGGVSKYHSGYLRVGTGIPKRYIAEHRSVAERALRRKLTYWEDVHHINGNKADNRPDNLVVLSKSEHTKLHWKLKKGV